MAPPGKCRARSSAIPGFAASVALLLAPAPIPHDAVDVVRYEIEVTLRGKDLSVASILTVTGTPPARWTLDLVPEMQVLSAESNGRPVAYSKSERGVTLDLAGVSADHDESFGVTIRCEGSPAEHFSEDRGGFVRSAVKPERAYVRSQVPWYPRASGDPAIHHVTIDAPSGWQVRSAGDIQSAPSQGDRARWVFETKSPVDRAGFAAGPWKLVSKGRYDALVEPGHEKTAEGLLGLTEEVLAFQEKELGALPRSRFALVELPSEFGPGSGYSECGYFLLGPNAFEDGAEPKWVQGFLAHEAAHQWWGHDGLFSDFANEALAEYAKLRFLEAQGDVAAKELRRSAVEKVAAAAAAGRTIALGEIQGWGERIDADTYRVHAYEKAMMLIVMVERAIGHAAMSKLLSRFLGDARSRRVGWKDLRAVLIGSCKEARAIVECWEQPGIPVLQVEMETKQQGNAWITAGKLTQSGTAQPYAMRVVVAAMSGEKRSDTEAKLVSASTPFSIRSQGEPTAIVVDPDWVLLAGRASKGSEEAKRLLETAMKTANDVRASETKILEKAIEDLRVACNAEVLSEGERAAARTGLGRCLFRLGKLDEARKELEEALRVGAGGPFHRGWAHLRLGCIADLAKQRKQALEHYQAVIDSKGSSGTAIEKAKAFQAKAYRGFSVDG
jgi:tetratricopeptide (TPR) repeat protein